MAWGQSTELALHGPAKHSTRAMAILRMTGLVRAIRPSRGAMLFGQRRGQERIRLPTEQKCMQGVSLGPHCEIVPHDQNDVLAQPSEKAGIDCSRLQRAYCVQDRLATMSFPAAAAI